MHTPYDTPSELQEVNDLDHLLDAFDTLIRTSEIGISKLSIYAQPHFKEPYHFRPPLLRLITQSVETLQTLELCSDIRYPILYDPVITSLTNEYRMSMSQKSPLTRRIRICQGVIEDIQVLDDLVQVMAQQKKDTHGTDDRHQRSTMQLELSRLSFMISDGDTDDWTRFSGRTLVMETLPSTSDMSRVLRKWEGVGVAVSAKDCLPLQINTGQENEDEDSVCCGMRTAVLLVR
ncbi:hypothetical protein BDV98DRAFT_606359 [Pterulicium gracile]|uniref:Uncharacterized protein n=1 Tax=Pterulicium gracile TaxID=1884261 RepID=A0A5C3QDL2_9AGAR|nr:hypothetical protein BDV98DRAFT_606359 [Pterula gracilis]